MSKIPAENYIKRQKALLRAMASKDVDAFCVSSLFNVRWLTGFKCSYGRVLAAGKNFYLLTDARYTADARRAAAGAEVVEITANLMDSKVKEILRSHGVKRLSVERDIIVLGEYQALKDELARDMKIESRSGLVENLRIVKDEHEIEAIHRACRTADKAFSHALTKIRAGVTEKFIASEMDGFMIGQQVDGLAFETIVAAGPRGAFPHAQPTGRKLRNGDLVVLDFGVCLDGYNSDTTRTVAVGRPRPELEKMYRAVHAAQAAAREAARAGMTCRALDAVARKALAGFGLAKHFTHGLGHGVGLEIHELPRVSSVSDAVLKRNMIFTIEPGVYVEGVGGVRIEDTVALTADGLKVLTHSPKKLIVV